MVISEFVGTFNRCWSCDIQVFYDENEKDINHLNICHTVKIDVIPTIKAVFSSSYVILFILGSVFIISISSLSSFVNPDSSLVLIILISCFCSLLDLISGFFFG